MSGARIADLELALGWALNTLIQFEPGDSRAVSNEFVAAAAILCESDADMNECRAILSDAPNPNPLKTPPQTEGPTQ